MSEPIDLQADMHVRSARRTDANGAGARPVEMDRITAIRERYARGVYDAPEVLEVVARRLLARGAV